jgi:TPR repeat protein
MMSHEQSPGSGQSGAVSRHALYVAAAVIVIAAAAVFLFYPRTGSPPESEAPAAASSSARGDTARNAIAKLQAQSKPDYDAAYQQGQAFQKDGQLADAQLMYFYAARGGQADAAFALGTMNDPNHFSPESSLMKKPDPFQAYKWYKQASDGGVAAAADRLAALHDWTKKQADDGDVQAQQLLLQWK